MAEMKNAGKGKKESQFGDSRTRFSFLKPLSDASNLSAADRKVYEKIRAIVQLEGNSDRETLSLCKTALRDIEEKGALANALSVELSNPAIPDGVRLARMVSVMHDYVTRAGTVSAQPESSNAQEFGSPPRTENQDDKQSEDWQTHEIKKGNGDNLRVSGEEDLGNDDRNSSTDEFGHRILKSDIIGKTGRLFVIKKDGEFYLHEDSIPPGTDPRDVSEYYVVPGKRAIGNITVPEGCVGVAIYMGGKAYALPLGPGRHRIPLANKVALIPTTPVVMRDDSKYHVSEKITIGVDMELHYEINPVYATLIFGKYGTEYEQLLVKPLLQEIIRTIINKAQPEDFYTAENVNNFLDSVYLHMLDGLKPYGIFPTLLRMADMTLPPEILKIIGRSKLNEYLLLEARLNANLKLKQEELKSEVEVKQVRMQYPVIQEQALLEVEKTRIEVGLEIARTVFRLQQRQVLGRLELAAQELDHALGERKAQFEAKIACLGAESGSYIKRLSADATAHEVEKVGQAEAAVEKAHFQADRETISEEQIELAKYDALKGLGASLPNIDLKVTPILLPQDLERVISSVLGMFRPLEDLGEKKQTQPDRVEAALEQILTELKNLNKNNE